MVKRNLFILAMLSLSYKSSAQFLMDMVDTTTETGKNMLSIYKNYEHLRFTGYIQPQFQISQFKGAKSFEGGDFGPRVSNRFMLRRSRVRIDYVHFDKDDKPGGTICFSI